MKTLTVSDAAHNFSDLVNRIRFRGESVLIVNGTQPMVMIRPARRVKTGRELAARWPKLPHLTPNEAESFERDLTDSRRLLSAIKSPWA
jgi:antitoxin (DNA-binding transcriptional repressor) of toxin-antitoxin stability system